MKWTKVAEQDLRKYIALKRSIINIKERLEIIESRYTGAKGARTDTILSNGGRGTREDSIINAIVEKERLKMQLGTNEKLIEVIERGLQGLNEMDRCILERAYIIGQKRNIEDIMKEYNVEKSQAYRMRDKALRNFALNMYGIEEF